jgi:predicted metal-dependent HD superfamily phosphohydrolase
VIAEKALTAIGFPADKKELCKQHILATKTHHKTDNPATNFLIDADLSILAQSWEIYEAYMKNIRKETSFIPILFFMQAE